MSYPDEFGQARYILYRRVAQSDRKAGGGTTAGQSCSVSEFNGLDVIALSSL